MNTAETITAATTFDHNPVLTRRRLQVLVNSPAVTCATRCTSHLAELPLY